MATEIINRLKKEIKLLKIIIVILIVLLFLLFIQKSKEKKYEQLGEVQSTSVWEQSG